MKNRFTTRYIVIAALFITILTPMTGANANGSLDNTFGNNDPKNGIYTLAGSVSDGAIFYDLAAQGNKSIIVGSKANDLIVVRLDSSGELDPTFGTAGSFLYDTSSPTSYSAENVAVDSVSGSIYVSGTKGSFDLFVLKLTSAGALDPDFGVGGVLSITAASVDTSYALTPAKIMLY